MIRLAALMVRRATLLALLLTTTCGVVGCGRSQRDAGPATQVQAVQAKAIVLVTIDTLRADRVGVYGWRAARTSAIDALAARGVRADRAYATAPITLTSHASLLTGLYPPKHGARHNGMRVRADVPTLAEILRARGFATGAFVAAFPLDRRFGLDRGFDVYSDALPRGPDGRPRNERPGREVVDEALAWLSKRDGGAPYFLWVHLFEPHAPYEGDPAFGPANATRSVSDRYDDEIAKADAQVARLVHAIDARADSASTLIIVAGDHGEAFGEHGEIGHSIFIYDTTLRVPLVLSGAPIASRATGPQAQVISNPAISEPVSLVDVLPTILDLAGLPKTPSDGESLVPALTNGPAHANAAALTNGPGSPGSPGDPNRSGVGVLGARQLYAESFAPFYDFGWSPLRSLRTGDVKYIAAPKAELYDLAHDAAEMHNLIAERPDTAKTLADRIDREYEGDGGAHARAASAGPATPAASAASAAPTVPPDRESLARLRSLGYLASATNGARAPASAVSSARASPAASAANAASSPTARAHAPSAGPDLPDPKDRVELASRVAEVTSGELQGAALRAALERLVRDDPRNGQMQMRLGFVLLEDRDCRAAVPHFQAAIGAAVPSADPQLGLAECLVAAGQREAARRALASAERVEPGNPVVSANLGLLALDEGHVKDAIPRLRAALDRAPDLLQARFALARAYGRAGQRADAAREARELLKRLPPDAPQRPEVERLLAAVQ